MLSRIAESMFWIGRYVERAEDTARILDVQTQLILEDSGVDEPLVGLGGRVRVDALGARQVPDRGHRGARPEGAGGDQLPHSVLDLAPDRHRQRRVDADAGRVRPRAHLY